MIEQQDPKQDDLPAAQAAQARADAHPADAVTEDAPKRSRSKEKKKNGPDANRGAPIAAELEPIEPTIGSEIVAEVKAAEPVQKMAGEDGGKRRLSFFVRIMLDERGEPRRTEIEYMQTVQDNVQQRQYKNFNTLNGDQLVAFMRSCIPPLNPPAASPPQPIPPPDLPLGRFDLGISDPRVFKKNAGDAATLSLHRDEDFVIGIGFELRGEEGAFGWLQDSDYEISVYADEIGGSRQQLIASSHGHFQKDTRDYRARIEAEGLPAGVYRLVTLVTIPGPAMRKGYVEGPIILVR